jgi:PAS domain S-box-containing protein
MSESPTVPREARHQLYEVIRGGDPFEVKAREALEVGTQYLGADSGYLARTDRDTDHWQAIVSTDDDGPVPAGLELDLGTTYCQRTLDAPDGQIALHDATEQGWRDDVAYTTYGLNCYLGTTLIVDGEPYGTACFVAEEPRDEPFSEDETMFAEFVARLLERELERTRHEADLTQQTNLATVLNRVLRHNLRNDLSVIRGYTQLMANELDDSAPGAVALRHIDDLISLSETARELDEIVAADADRKPTDITAVVERVAAAVSKRYPDATVSVDADLDLTASVFPSFERAIRELIQNAAKHGGEAPTIAVSVDATDEAFTVRVADDGPGLADAEASVVETGTETPLIHGSGLGLWLVHWVVSTHEGSIAVDSDGDGTTMTVSVPRYSDAAVNQQTRLNRARDRYRAAFEESQDAMLLCNDDARIVDANPAASEVYALGRSELLGRSLGEFLPEDTDIAVEWEQFKAAGAERDTVTIVAADGVERSIEYSAKADIVPGQHLVIVRDVTERIENERALAETTERLEAVVDVSPDPIIALDAEGRIQLWNSAAEATFGFDADAVVGEPIQSLGLHDEDQLSEFEAQFRRALDGERISGYEIARRTKDGDRVRLRISTAPLRNGDDDVVGVVAIGERLPT